MTTAESFDGATIAMRNLIAALKRIHALIKEERWSTHFANPANQNTAEKP